MLKRYLIALLILIDNAFTELNLEKAWYLAFINRKWDAVKTFAGVGERLSEICPSIRTAINCARLKVS